MNKKLFFSETLQSLSGKIQYTLLNDAVFHIAMNRAPMVSLRGLISSFLGIPANVISRVDILNPIDYKSAAAKQTILDVKVEFNNSGRLNIELQTYRNEYWSDRSLLYLGRTFDNLGRGDNYSLLIPTTQISIMTYDLFPKHPEFYAHYLMKNAKNGNVYSTNFKLNVLCLPHEDLATEENIANRLVDWAKLFKVKTWEELKALAHSNPILKEVAESMAITNTSETEKYLAQAHEDWLVVPEGVYVGAFKKGFSDGAKETREKYESIIAEKDALLKQYQELYGNLPKE